MLKDGQCAWDWIPKKFLKKLVNFQWVDFVNYLTNIIQTRKWLDILLKGAYNKKAHPVRV